MGCGSSKLLKESEAKAAELQAKVTELEGKVALAEKGLASAMGRASQAEAKATEMEEKAKEVKAPEKAEAEAVSQENTIERQSIQLESVYKSWQKEACAHAFIECEALFEDVDDAQKVKCAEAMHPINCSKGQILVHQGDDSEAHFSVVAFGNFNCHVIKDKHMKHSKWAETEINDDTATLVKTYTAGEFFGEIGVMNDLPRQASITCTSPTALLWSLSKTDCARATLESRPHTLIARQMTPSVRARRHQFSRG